MLALHSLLLLLASCTYRVASLDIDTSSTDSINTGLSKIAKGVVDYYNGNQPGQTPGMFQPPYYWWQSGAAWGSLLHYWYFTGDTSYNNDLYESLLWQAGTNYDYLPENQTKTEGNDDQGYWGITLMDAAERGFPQPGDQPGWSERVENIVKSMISRWDTDNCGGGLRWQIYPWNKGYEYKNTVSNGCLFHLAARLSRFNGESTYIEWAEKTWDWMSDHDFIVTNVSAYKVLDGAPISSNCLEISPEQWTYNAGLMLSGTAYLYDHTKDSKWLDRARSIWEGCNVFFKNDVTLYEASCQVSNRCNNDQRSFKAYFSRFLGLTAMVLPDLSDDIMRRLGGTVPGILSSCSGGSDGHTCGLDWDAGKWDGVFGLGEQMSALETLQNALLVKSKPGPADKNGESALQDQMHGLFGAPKAAPSDLSSDSSSTNDAGSSSADGNASSNSSESSASWSSSDAPAEASSWTDSATAAAPDYTSSAAAEAPADPPADPSTSEPAPSAYSAPTSSSSPDPAFADPPTVDPPAAVDSPAADAGFTSPSAYDSPEYVDGPSTSQVVTIPFNSPLPSSSTSSSSWSSVQQPVVQSFQPVTTIVAVTTTQTSPDTTTTVHLAPTSQPPAPLPSTSSTSSFPSATTPVQVAHQSVPVQVQAGDTGAGASTPCLKLSTVPYTPQYPSTAILSTVGVHTISTITNSDGSICEVIVRTIDVYN